jgi:hypothetical protein
MIAPTSTATDVWLDRFWRAFYTRRPVDASFIGRHEHDHVLPDLGRDGADETLDEMRDLLSRAPRPDPLDAPLSALDQRLAEGFLRIQIREQESRHLLANPSVHVGEAVFGLMSLLLPNLPPTTQRLDALRARMDAIPDFLERAREALDSAPAPWIERAARECRGGATFVRDGVTRLGKDLAGAPERAATALERFRSWLGRELEVRPSDDVGCGAETFALYLEHGHFFERPAEDVADYAREEIASLRSELEAAAGDFGASTPEEALAGLADAHPSADEYYGRYRETWEAMFDVSERESLLTWPAFPIRYVPRPAWARAAASDLYFLFYRSPAAFERPEVHDYLVAPLDASAASADQEAFLRANNDSVIKLNHVVHHGGIGHHVQNWHAFRSPLSVGRVAAVDGASRIAMFCGGTMAEGWACYATDLMAEVGALTPLEAYAERHGRIRMCARAVVDVELHHGRMGLDDAARFYRDTAGMSEAAAASEAVKNSMFPAAALMYLVGTDAIHELRRDLTHLTRGALPLRDFHDAFLSYGSIPVPLVAREMKRRAELGLPLGAHETLEVAGGQTRPNGAVGSDEGGASGAPS